MTDSGILVPFRALGLVSNAVPFAALSLGTETFLTVPIGKSFQIYDTKRLRLLFVGPQFGHSVRAVAAYRNLTFVAAGCDIHVLKRAALVRTLSGHSGKVNHLLVFGDHLLSVGEDRLLKVWVIASGELHGELALVESAVTALVHPATYVNMILVGYENGQLELWDLEKQTLAHTYAGWGSAVTALAGSPALDVVAIGLKDGSIVLHNLKVDKTLFSFSHVHGPATAIDFRTDGQPVMVSANGLGEMITWNLEKRTVVWQTEAHHGAVSRLHFMSDQPVLVSAGADNALKMWIFDRPDFTGRVLRHRVGHSAPPSRIKFYPNPDTHMILSACLDNSLRMFNTIQDHQNCELSQGAGLAKKAKKWKVALETLKFTPAVDFAACDMRRREWADIVSAHTGPGPAHAWTSESRRHADVAFPPTDKSAVRSVCISVCGHFAFLGTSLGGVDKYNIQSGIHRGDVKAHSGPVTGIATDATNLRVITTSTDATVKVWNFRTLSAICSMEVGSPVSRMVYNHDSSLVAVACDDWVLRMFDVDTQKLVRVLRGHSNVITDLTFSPDMHWLLSSSVDSTVRVWDIPSGRLVDWFSCKDAPVSLALSPSGDFLATAHLNQPAIFLWANKTFYSNVLLRPVSGPAPTVALPAPMVVEEEEADKRPQANSKPQKPSASTTDNSNNSSSSSSSSGGGSASGGLGSSGGVIGHSAPMEIVEESGQDGDDNENDDGAEFVVGGPQLSPDLLTLSANVLSRPRLQTLSNIDLVKQRNKPAEAPKALEPAPFFLYEAPGQGLFTSKLNLPESDPARPTSKILDFGKLQARSKLAELLELGNDSDTLSYLQALPPSAVDVEVRGLNEADEFVELKWMLEFLDREVKAKNNFEMVQAYLNLFLQIHGDTIATNLALTELAETLRKSVRELERSTEPFPLQPLPGCLHEQPSHWRLI
eukprot:gnl/Hemi2/14424_TR4887_c0_g1_i1.p1 gnl/Hemi2/14424_TR4887_c0_g1~~gnl/Hemi2/14424_TR4887_c0_g1_i1.p1  ORF type:complete len:937 (-),score=245.99 gnl/Hemi2/14424_TR4887_c0_g1_i1:109-2919(-)